MSSVRVSTELAAVFLQTGEDFDVCFVFDSNDPCAVTLQCADGVWVIDRETLTAALITPQGEGAVELELLEGFPQRLALQFNTPPVLPKFSVPVEPLWVFLRKVYEIVPVGGELLFTDVEEEMRQWEGNKND